MTFRFSEVGTGNRSRESAVQMLKSVHIAGGGRTVDNRSPVAIAHDIASTDQLLPDPV